LGGILSARAKTFRLGRVDKTLRMKCGSGTAHKKGGVHGGAQANVPSVKNDSLGCY
jgi:hypothetical protein